MSMSARLAARGSCLPALFICFAAFAQQGTLPTIAELSQQPQPQIKLFSFQPVVQEFAPGQVSMKTGTLVFDVQRVTYTPTGVEIEGQAEQTKASTGIVTFNHLQKGALRDDTGTIFHLRDPKDDLRTTGAKKGDRWKVRIVTAGYLQAAAKTMTLTLNVARSHINPELMEASWPVPPGLRTALGGSATPTALPGKGISYAPPASVNSPAGYLSMRVYRVQWLQDGIAIEFDALNTAHHMPTELNGGAWAMKLVDDKNRQYKLVQPDDLAIRPIDIPADHMMAGRLLFSPPIAPDAKRLRLLTNFGPKGPDLWAPIAAVDDNMRAPKLGLDLGIIPPQAMPPPSKPMAAVLKSTQKLPPVTPMAVSTIDPIARLKQELGATDGAQGSTVDLPGDVFFDFDKATLRADAAATLDKLADLIQRVGRPVQVSGHTDSKGDAAYNKKLSQERAAAVKAALVKRGISAGTIQSAGYGKDKPKAANTNQDGSDNPKGREINRRVEVLISKS